jgi:hypothetical protein
LPLSQYEHFNPPVKPVGEIYHKEPAPLQTKDSAAAVTVGKKTEKAAVSEDLGKTQLAIASDPRSSGGLQRRR